MDEPLAWPAAVLASITKVLFVAGLFIAFSTLNGTAQQCGRGQVLIVGRHTCVSHETFQQFQRAWRTGKATPSVSARRADPPAKTADTKPGAASPKPPVAAEAAPVPTPKPVVAAATPPAPAARDMSTTPAEVTTATPMLTAAPVAAVTPSTVPPAPPPATTKKPSSPYGELQLR